ncbi:MAG TPA: Sir2 family NAD-dependent protein deacetylase, partial [Mucilaginibacter sp.]|nr:Sir2 family NAD-dependent protein deacetylase [Mucilaginibacter sp.]
TLTYPVNGWEIEMGELCELGSQLRAHVVWFGEDVPMIIPAAKVCQQADIFILVGSSLAVYPAAGLISYVHYDVPKYIIDPNIPDVGRIKNVTRVEERAGTGVPQLVERLMAV